MLLLFMLGIGEGGGGGGTHFCCRLLLMKVALCSNHRRHTNLYWQSRPDIMLLRLVLQQVEHETASYCHCQHSRHIATSIAAFFATSISRRTHDEQKALFCRLSVCRAADY